jgi:hypothetical protein
LSDELEEERRVILWDRSLPWATVESVDGVKEINQKGSRRAGTEFVAGNAFIALTKTSLWLQP